MLGGFLLRNCLLQANCTTLCMCDPVVNDMELRFHTTERFTLKNYEETRWKNQVLSHSLCFTRHMIVLQIETNLWQFSLFSHLSDIFKQQFICLNFESMARDCPFELGLISSITTFTNFRSINLSCVPDTVSSVYVLVACVLCNGDHQLDNLGWQEGINGNIRQARWQILEENCNNFITAVFNSLVFES